MTADVTNLGWTMVLNGKEYRASIELTDGPVSEELIRTTLKLLNKQVVRTIEVHQPVTV